MAKKAATKKTPTKKAATPGKKAPAKKAAAKKAVKKAVPAKKAKSAPAKKAVKKKSTTTKTAPSKKTASKKAAPKKTSPKKAAAPKKKAAPAKKAPSKKAAPQKAAPKKSTQAKETTSVKKPAAPKSSATKNKEDSKQKPVAAKKPPVKKRVPVKKRPIFSHLAPQPPAPSTINGNHGAKPKKLSPAFLKKQKQKLLDLRDTLLDQMTGVARDSLGSREDGGDASAFGMHQADAGSDAYDRDFALNILSQEQDALHEIEEALVRIDTGEYGVCQGSGDAIPQARLEAMPFARCTVEFQEKLDLEQARGSYRPPVHSLFGLDEKEVVKGSSEDED